MFSFSSFSRAFIGMHRSLFLIDSTRASLCAVATDSRRATATGEERFPTTAGAKETAVGLPADREARLKSLCRRTLRGRQDDSLTYSGQLRHCAG